MNDTHGLQNCATLSRPSFVDPDVDSPRPFAPSSVPVLIQVPMVRPARRKPKPARRASATATARFRANAIPHRGHRPKRRLRKGVRVSGYAVLAAVSFGLAALLLRGGAGASTSGVAPRADHPQVAAASVRPPAVSLTVEGAPGASPVEPATPVILPGYLLPDDGVEESTHAGG